ncbi:hypothetical protein OQA88_11651 [Cercophora sp. LCS_1]
MSESKSGYAAVKSAPDDQPGFDEVKLARREKRVQVLRIIQSILSAILSIAIAAFQGRVYWTYQSTKGMPGAWPPVPDLAPTILLFSVAIAALVFDGCMIVAYLRPTSRFARWAIRIGGAAHYVVATGKTVSYGISAAISKTSYNWGNASGQNADLWGYTCTDSAAAIEPIHAESNCNCQASFHHLSFLYPPIQIQTDSLCSHSLLRGRSPYLNSALSSSVGSSPSWLFDSRAS